MAQLKKYINDDVEAIFEQQDIEAKRMLLKKWLQWDKVRVIVAFSGGKDSVAMVLYLLFTLQVPAHRIELWHHKVDGAGETFFDWACTDSYCRAFAAHFGLRLLFSYRDGGIEREIYRKDETLQDIFFQEQPDGQFYRVRAQQDDRYKSTRYKFPAVSTDLSKRWCSSTVKISVGEQVIRNISRLKRCNLLFCSGERRAESPARATYNEIEPHRTCSLQRRAVHWRPVIDFSDSQVWQLIEAYRVQPHPCYMLGYSRCSCQCCIFSSPNTWATTHQLNPEKIDRIAEIEREISFTLYSDTDIRGKVAEGNSFYTSDLAYWRAQANGEFTAPIICDTWHLPKGAKSRERAGSV